MFVMEALVANMALKIPAIFVNSTNMVDQNISVSEQLVTHRALEVFDLVVNNFDVRVEVSLLGVNFAAQ